MSITEEIRLAVCRKMSGEKVYPHKGKMSLRQVSKESGVKLSTLQRFICGRVVQSDVLDMLREWTK